jgi:hypothetical protein
MDLQDIERARTQLKEELAEALVQSKNLQSLQDTLNEVCMSCLAQGRTARYIRDPNFTDCGIAICTAHILASDYYGIVSYILPKASGGNNSKDHTASICKCSGVHVFEAA